MVLTFIKQLRAVTSLKNFCLAFSGGVDSTVLVHLFNKFKQIEPNLSLRAIHVHHGLNQFADDWVISCQDICDRYHMPLLITYLNLPKKTKYSLEELARIERYQIFKTELRQNEVLVTAHHQEDQAETLLLQLFRGAGPKGLASMPMLTNFGQGFLLRPLLNFAKKKLLQFAEKENLNWIEDESNRDSAFDRNFLRQQIFPLLTQRWPSISKNLARSAWHCAQADHFIEAKIKLFFEEIFSSESKTLDIFKLIQHDFVTQSYIVRFWLKFLKFPLPNTKKIFMLLEQMVNAKIDSMPLLCWQEVEIRRFKGQLYAMPSLPAHDVTKIIPWDLKADLVLDQDKIITRHELTELGLHLADLQNVTIRYRRGGENCRLPGRHHHHALKKLLQAWRVPPWERDRIPLLYTNEMLCAIVGYTACGT